MNWRKEERTDGKTSSLPAVCRTDPDYSGDGLVWRFLDMEIARREETMAVGRTRGDRGQSKKAACPLAV